MRAMRPSDLGGGNAKPAPWMKRGACTDYPLETFFPPDSESSGWARDICNNDCPVKERCLDYALFECPNPSNMPGIFGGTTMADRQRILRERRRRNAA